MPNPIRRRNFALLIFVIGAGSALAAIALPDGGGLRTALGLGGVTATFFALVAGLLRHGAARRYARLRRGEGVLARWTVEPGQWRAFVELSRSLDRESDRPHNDLRLSVDPTVDGIEVIVSGEAVCVGEDFYPVEKDAKVRTYESYMEFEQLIVNQDGGDLRTLHRIPVARGAEPEAELIGRHYGAAYVEAARSPKFKIYILIGIIGLFLLSLLLEFLPRLLSGR